MRITLAILPLIAALSTTSFGDQWYVPGEITQSANIDLQPLRCPTVGKDYSQMVSDLHALQDKIKGDANCGKLKENLEKIGQLSGDRRTQFLETISKINEGGEVRDKEMSDRVIKYAEDVTVAAGSLASLLTQSDQCFGKQDMSTSLFTLSAFVNEASTMLSTVAGPWGPALAIGGKVVSGFLSGVDKFIKSIPGYDFKDKKDWQGYVETLCSFHEQQDEIAALIHPEVAIQDLNQLNTKIGAQISGVLNKVPQGNELLASFQEKDNEKLHRLSQAIDDQTRSTLGLHAVRLMTAQRWILQRIESIEEEANDPLAPGQYLVQKQRDEIEDFLIARQGPKFIDFQVAEARRDLSELDRLVQREGTYLYSVILSLSPEKENNIPAPVWPTADEVLNTLLKMDETQFIGKGFKEEQIYSSLSYFKREISKRWDAVSLSYGVKTSFCEFFRRAGYYNSGLNGSCSARSSFKVEQRMSDYEKMGLNKVVPTYLRKAAHYQGLNWTESLNLWLNQAH